MISFVVLRNARCRFSFVVVVTLAISLQQSEDVPFRVWKSISAPLSFNVCDRDVVEEDIPPCFHKISGS